MFVQKSSNIVVMHKLLLSYNMRRVTDASTWQTECDPQIVRFQYPKPTILYKAITKLVLISNLLFINF